MTTYTKYEGTIVNGVKFSQYIPNKKLILKLKGEERRIAIHCGSDSADSPEVALIGIDDEDPTLLSGMHVTVFLGDGKLLSIRNGFMPDLSGFSIETQYRAQLSSYDIKADDFTIPCTVTRNPDGMITIASVSQKTMHVIRKTEKTKIYLSSDEGEYKTVVFGRSLLDEFIADYVFLEDDYSLLDGTCISNELRKTVLISFNEDYNGEEKELIRVLQGMPRDKTICHMEMREKNIPTAAWFVLPHYKGSERTILEKALKQDEGDEYDEGLESQILTIQALRPFILREMSNSSEKIRKKLENAFPGQKTLKRKLPIYLTRPGISTNVLLVGPPATCRYLAENVLEAASFEHCVTYDVGSDTDNRLFGVQKNYQGAAPSLIARDLVRSGLEQTGCIFLGIDGALANGAKKNGNPFTIIKDLVLQHGFRDHNMEIFIDAPAVSFYISESRAAIPIEVVNGMDLVLGIEDFSIEELSEIYRRNLIELIGEKDIDKEAISCYLAENCTGYDPIVSIRNNLGLLERLLLENVQSTFTTDDVALWCDHSTEDESVYCRLRANAYSDIQKQKIALARDRALNAVESETYRTMWKKQLDVLSRLHSTTVALDDDAVQKISEIHYGHTDMVEELKCVLNTIPMGSFSTLFFYGPPGCGKTSICEACLSCFNEAVLIRLDASEITSLEALCGDVSRNMMSVFEKKILESNSEGGYIVLSIDELDKAPIQIQDALMSIVENRFVSQFSDMHIEIKAVFATANDINKVIEPLRDRFAYKFYLDGFTEIEKTAAVPVILKNEMKRFPRKSVDIDQEAAEYLSKTTNDCGMRNMSSKINQLIARKVGGERGVSENTVVRISIEDCASIFKKEYFPDYIPTRMNPGQCLCMAVRDDGQGIISTMTATLLPSEKNHGIVLSSLIKGSAENAIESRAVVWVRRHFHEVNRLLDNNTTLHLDISGDADKDGSSLGVASVIAVLSCIYGFAMDNKTAFTGSIEADGGIRSCGGTKMKVDAAIRNGCTRVFVPRENVKDVKDMSGIEIITAENLSELLSNEEIIPSGVYHKYID